MIYELTKENLLNAGLNETDANKLFNTIDNYTLQCNEGNFFVSKPKNKFYTGVDFWRESYFYNGNLSFPFACPELMSEYYNLALTEFLEKQKELFGTVFIKKNQTENFIKLETKRSEEIIKEHKDYIELHNKRQWKSKERLINILETYIQFIENELVKNKQTKEPQQNNLTKTDLITVTRNVFKSIDTYKLKNALQKPVPFFITSKGELIDLRPKKDISKKIKTSYSQFTITLKHIALKAYYEGNQITESNASDFLKKTPYTSGKKLYQFYLEFASNTDRKSDPESKTKLKNKIKLFKDVITLLDENKKDKVIDEVKILESFITRY